MVIFNSFLVGVSSLCHSVVFILCVYSFRENVFVSAMEHLRQRGINETKSNVNKNMST